MTSPFSIVPPLAESQQHQSKWHTLYATLLLSKPWFSLLFLCCFVFSAVYFIPQFDLDASADSLTLEADKDVAYYRTARETFPSSDDFLVIAYQPVEPLFSLPTLNKLAQLKQSLLSLESVKAVNSILDVPLLNHPNISLTTISRYHETLEQLLAENALDESSLEESRKALQHNPLYRNLLISEDAAATAVQVVLKSDPAFAIALNARNELRVSLSEIAEPSQEQLQNLNQLELEVSRLNQASIDANQKTIADIRVLMQPFQTQDKMFLGGIPMIVVDMLDYVSSDLETFGIGVVLFLVLMLALIFRKVIWVVIPLFCCVVTCVTMIGFLGFLRFPVTVISSNFVSLLLIITMSMIIHLVVRYRELVVAYPEASQKQLVGETTRQLFLPCFYTGLTTIVAFLSLLVSNIRPVIDFGLMMTIGIGFAFATVFLLFPPLLALLPKQIPKVLGKQGTGSFSFSSQFARLTNFLNWRLLLIAAVVAGLSIVGISRLTVENRFLDYFKTSTEIYQGMEMIDARLGGTTPLDIIIDIPIEKPSATGSEGSGDCFLDDDCLEDTYATSTVFTAARIRQIQQIHQFIDDLPETGKVLSLATTIAVAEQIKGSPLESLELAFVQSMFPEELKGFLLEPYVNESVGQVRFTVRVKESSTELKRQVLLDKIHGYLVTDMALNPTDVHFTSMVVLYNNMLQSLFRSQIATVGVVFVLILGMFLILFRSMSVAVIAMLPNLLAAAVVMGMMGWLSIPLDMMTITIAAISVGIAVDDTIHYIYCFRSEFRRSGSYQQAMLDSHLTIGSAMYYTSITIIFGFSILVFSNFFPTLYFGLFTGLAMLIALLSSLTLLPYLLVALQPFGEESQAESVS